MAHRLREGQGRAARLRPSAAPSVASSSRRLSGAIAGTAHRRRRIEDQLFVVDIAERADARNQRRAAQGFGERLAQAARGAPRRHEHQRVGKDQRIASAALDDAFAQGARERHAGWNREDFRLERPPIRARCARSRRNPSASSQPLRCADMDPHAVETQAEQASFVDRAVPQRIDREPAALGRAVEQPRMHDLHAGPHERRELHLRAPLQHAQRIHLEIADARRSRWR